MSHPAALATTTLLSAELELRIRTALRDHDQLIQTRSADEFRRRAMAAADDIAVLEPGYDAVVPLYDGYRWTSGVPVVAYTRLTPRAVAATLALARTVATSVEILMAGVGDQPGPLRARLSDIALSERGAVLYECIAPALTSLPEPMQRGILEFCRTATARDSVPHLAKRCATSRAALARWLARCGIRRPRTLVIGARLVRGYDCLVSDGVPLRTTAALLCHGTIVTLRGHVHHVSGMTLEEVRARHQFDEFVRRVAVAITGVDTRSDTGMTSR